MTILLKEFTASFSGVILLKSCEIATEIRIKNLQSFQKL